MSKRPGKTWPAVAVLTMAFFVSAVGLAADQSGEGQGATGTAGRVALELFMAPSSIDQDWTDSSPASDQPAEAESESEAAPEDEAKDQTRPPLRIKITFPAIHIEKSEMVIESDQPSIPILVPGLDNEPMGVWGGGRLAFLMMPLSDRLEPMTKVRGLDPFDDTMLLVGFQGGVSFSRVLSVAGFFETGFQGRDDVVGGVRNEADVTVSRLGLAAALMIPVEFSGVSMGRQDEDAASASPISLGLTVRPAVGFGLDLGVGSLSLLTDGPKKSHIALVPFLFLNPKLIVGVTLLDHARLEFYGGYSLMVFNSISREFYLEDKNMVSGSGFNGWVLGMQMTFGVENIYDLIKVTWKAPEE